MRLLIDGDACPDRQKVIELALHYGVEVLLFIDFAHVIEDERIQIIMCEVNKLLILSSVILFPDT